MIMYHLGSQLGVWIMQVSTFSSVLINRFHCNCKCDCMTFYILSKLPASYWVVVLGKVPGEVLRLS